jgi:hypothetical protein
MSLGFPLRRRSEGGFTISVHAEPSIVIPDIVWSALSRSYPGMMVHVEVVPRPLVRELWARDMGSKPFPGYYAFRAYTRGDRVVLLSDTTETPQSLTWLLLHELAHVEVNRAPLLDAGLRSIPRPKDYLTSDQAHESWPEERLANLVADRLAPLFGSRPGLNRLWWRSRVRSVTGS